MQLDSHTFSISPMKKWFFFLYPPATIWKTFFPNNIPLNIDYLIQNIYIQQK